MAGLDYTGSEQRLLDENAALKEGNSLPRQRLDLVLRKLFRKSGGALDPAHLELLLGGQPPGKVPASTMPGDAPVVEASAASVA